MKTAGQMYSDMTNTAALCHTAAASPSICTSREQIARPPTDKHANQIWTTQQRQVRFNASIIHALVNLSTVCHAVCIYFPIKTCLLTVINFKELLLHVFPGLYTEIDECVYMPNGKCACFRYLSSYQFIINYAQWQKKPLIACKIPHFSSQYIIMIASQMMIMQMNFHKRHNVFCENKIFILFYIGNLLVIYNNKCY